MVFRRLAAAGLLAGALLPITAPFLAASTDSPHFPSVTLEGEPKIGGTIRFLISGEPGWYVGILGGMSEGPSTYAGHQIPIGGPLFGIAGGIVPDSGEVVFAEASIPCDHEVAGFGMWWFGFAVNLADGPPYSPLITDAQHLLVQDKYSTVRGVVYADANLNGGRDEGEPGIPSLLIEMRGAGPDVELDTPDDLVLETFTDINGEYAFPGHDPSRLVVRVVDFPDIPPTSGENPVVATIRPCQDEIIDFGFPAQDSGQGCSQGFWKQPHHFDEWPDQYAPGMPFSAVFDDAFPGKSLHDVIDTGGGGLAALGRQTVAALLNAATDEIAFGYTEGQVINMFNAAFAAGGDAIEMLEADFEARNVSGCPLGSGDENAGGEDDSSDKGGKGKAKAKAKAKGKGKGKGKGKKNN